MMKHRIILFLLTAFSLSFAQKTADFIILEKPQKYTILDQYQQPLGESGRGILVAGMPLKILNSDGLLGDQITHALEGSFDGQTWYLQKDDAGNLSGADEKENRRIYKGCEVGSDTVEILKDKAIAFSGARAEGGLFLNKQEKVVRIFRYRDLWYVRRTGHTAKFGWSAFPAFGAWRRVVTVVAVDTGISDYLQNRIVERFRSANDAYREYFAHFNKVTGKDKAMPVWRWDLRPGKTIFFFLNPPYGTTSWLDESTRYLVRDLENMLMGRRYDVIREKGGIVVKPKDTRLP